jgi:tRNA-dihydrouridine synthase B
METNFLKRPLLNGKVNFPLSLAPMVGMSHVALRSLVRRYTPADAVTIWPTEMLSSWRLPNEDVGRTPETFIEADEGPLVPQILGNEEKPIQQSVEKLVAWGAEGIDINMGCPVRKALKHNYGVALMGDAGYAAEVVRMTCAGSSVPVSVKLRAGLQNDREYLITFLKGLEDAGCAWITLHPRVGHLKRRGAADWEQIRFVRERLNIPVIGNGDVQCADDVWAMQEISDCDAVMVGRALAARPWLMWQVGERLGFAPPVAFASQVQSASGALSVRAPQTPLEEGAEYGRALLYFIDCLQRFFTFEQGFTRARFHVRMTCGWLEFGHYLFGAVSGAKSYEEMRSVVETFFAGPQKMTARTALRE